MQNVFLDKDLLSDLLDKFDGADDMSANGRNEMALTCAREAASALRAALDTAEEACTTSSDPIPTEDSELVNSGKFIGIAFVGGDASSDFWRIKCPCGVEVSFPVNGIPTVDTLHPCGNPNHWSVQYSDPISGEGAGS